MSNWNPNRNFDYKSWCEQQIAERAKEALAARDAAFAEEHARVPLAELARYLAREAAALRHSPAISEVDGGAFIARRFGSWDAALRAAGLPPTRAERKLNTTARYRREKKVQEPLFLAERKEKKRQKQIAKNLRKGQLAHEKAVKRRAKREAEKAAQAEREARKRAEGEAKAAALEASLAENAADAVPAAACAETSPCQAETV